MRKFEKSFMAVAALIALFIIVPQPSVGQEHKQAAAPSLDKKQASPQMLKRSDADKKLHRLILQVNSNEPANESCT